MHYIHNGGEEITNANANPYPKNYPDPTWLNGVGYECRAQELSNCV